MLFDVLVYETKFTDGKWWSSMQGRGEVDGGRIQHLGEYLKQCRIKTTWVLVHRRN